MNIYEYAKQMEKDGEDYYRRLARESNTPGLQKIFTMLADEEVKHYKVIEAMQRNIRETVLEDSPVLNITTNVFRDMREQKQPLHIDSSVETEKYRNARDIEEKSRQFYREQAGKAET